LIPVGAEMVRGRSRSGRRGRLYEQEMRCGVAAGSRLEINGGLRRVGAVLISPVLALDLESFRFSQGKRIVEQCAFERGLQLRPNRDDPFFAESEHDCVAGDGQRGYSRLADEVPDFRVCARSWNRLPAQRSLDVAGCSMYSADRDRSGRSGLTARRWRI